jgi:uncharacterized protein YcbK (DUF882 family)
MSYKSQYFKKAEYVCKCDGLCDHSAVLCDALLIALDRLREILGKPIIINSGVRCKAWNKSVGGQTNSYHMQCMAVDIRVEGVSPKDVAKAASKIPEFAGGGIGTYKSFCHLDVRGHRSRWVG